MDKITIERETLRSTLDVLTEMPPSPGKALVVSALRAALAAQPADAQTTPFQDRVRPWMLECFGARISSDKQERNHRFLEEALELVQACGCTESEAAQLVAYVYGRPAGDPPQEVGGVMVTLAALCLAQGMDMHAAGEVELARIWTKVEKIRAKQAAKPKHSPLPLAAQPAEPVAVMWLYPDGRRYTMTWVGQDEDRMQEMIAERGLIRRELYAASPAPAAVPPGYVLVPIEPTQAILDAPFVGKVQPQDWHSHKRSRELMAENYRAMIAAAGDKP